MKRIVLPILALLSACGTPQDQCINAATRDMRIVDRLILETEGNLARGYGYRNVTIHVPDWTDCTPDATVSNPDPRPKLCFEPVPRTAREPVAIDLAAERSKLTGLRRKRTDHIRAAEAAIAQCKAAYPE